MQKLLFTLLVTIITITSVQARVANVVMVTQPNEDIVAAAPSTPAFYEEPFFIAIIIFTALIIALVAFIKFFRKK